MASIKENRKKGKVISFRFTVCLGRDAEGKQIRKYKTWTPPESLTPAKARKAAEKEAEKWEIKIKAEYQEKETTAADVTKFVLPTEQQKDLFTEHATLI